MFTNFKELEAYVLSHKNKKRIVLANAHDEPALSAVVNAHRRGVVDGTLLGKKDEILALLREMNEDPAEYEIVDFDGPELDAAKAAVQKAYQDYKNGGYDSGADLDNWRVEYMAEDWYRAYPNGTLIAYNLNYEYHAQKPANVTLAGGAYVDEDGWCMPDYPYCHYLLFAEKDGHTYGLVILGCDTPDHLFAECDDLFDWAFASFADRPLVDTQTVLTTVDLTKCRTEPAVELYAAAPVSGYGHADDIVTYSFDLPESIAATVKSGSVVGTATVYLDGDEVGTVDLVTHKEYVSDFRTDMKATALLLCALLFILIALTAVTLAAGGNSLNLKRRKHRR